MTSKSKDLTIWCNAKFPPAAMDELVAGLGSHRLLRAPATATNLFAGAPDPLLAESDIALGQPDPEQMIALPRLRWTHLTSAGYTRYDRADLKRALTERGAILTNSSAVYAEPCAEHVLAMMMALARQLPQCQDEQRESRAWKAGEHRARSRLLIGQTALLLGFGAIGRRLAELVEPFRMQVIAIRRHATTGDRHTVQIESTDRVDDLLPIADHVVNLLPANPSTEGFMSASRLARMKPSAIFYNIGRGTTVDRQALLVTLQSRRIAGAYLDVTEPEPLPPEHPLWSAPNCFITPHTAGGHDAEFHRLAGHFLENLGRFERGESLLGRVV